MRALTAKEKNLLIGLLAALFVLLNVFGLQSFLNRQRVLESSIARMEAQQVENRLILEEEGLWMERAAWLDANQPTDDVETTSDDEKFHEFIESSAKKHGLTYLRREAGPRPPGEAYAEVFDISQVKGDMKALVQWLNELQQPKAFRAIKQLTIKSGEPPEVICDVEVARWYRPVRGGQQ